MFHFPFADRVDRQGDNITISNLLSSSTGAAMSVSLAHLNGTHARSLSKKSERAYYVVAGFVRFEVGHERIDAGPGDVVLVPKETYHALAGSASYIVVNVPAFDPAFEVAG